MSIAKVGSVKSSASAIDYVLNEKERDKKPKIICGNVLGVTKQEIKDEFQAQEKLNAKVKNTVTHIAVSFPANQRIADGFAADYADKLMDKLGYSDNPYLVVRHYDKDARERNSYAHIHIVASRVNNDGSLIDEWKNAEKVIAATKQTDREMNLKSTQYVKNSEERNIKKNEYRVMQASGKLSIMEEFKDTANGILEQIDSLNSFKSSLNEDRKIKIFVERIQEAGFEILPNFNEEGGAMRGFSYKKNEIIFGSHAAGNKFKWKNLASKVGYKADNDYRFLVELHAQTTDDILVNQATIIANPEQESTENYNDPDKKIVRMDVKDEKISSLIHHQSNVETETEKETVSDQLQHKNQVREIKINETTSEYSALQPSVQSNGDTISAFEKPENNSPEPAVALAEKTRIESVTSVEKAQTDGRKSSEIRDNPDDDAAVGSGESVVISATRNRRDGSRRTTEAVAFAGSNAILDEDIEGFKRAGRGGRSSVGSLGTGGENHEEKFITGEHRLSEVSVEDQRIKTEFHSGINDERNIDFGSGDRKKLTFGDGEYESEEANLRTEHIDKKLSNQHRQISSDGSDREKESAGSRNEAEKLEQADIEWSKIFGGSLDFVAGHDISNSKLSSKREDAGDDAEGEQRIENHESEDERREDRNREIDRTNSSVDERFFSDEFDDSRGQNRGFTATAVKAEIVAQIINVKYFSGQLDKKITDKWTNIIEDSKPIEFLKELIGSKNSAENERLLTDITRQAEIIAEDLSLPKPKLGLEPNPNLLAVTLTQIEVQNYEKSTSNKVNFLTLERIWNEKIAKFEESTGSEQIEKIKSPIDEFSDFSIFSTNLEMETFQALLDSEARSFDADYILEIEESVKRDELVAEELAHLVQIAYGGRNDIFTPQFKSSLAEEIYYEVPSATDLYKESTDSNWQKNVERFAPIVDTLAEQEGILIQPPASVSEKNSFLAEYFTDRVVFLYEQNHGQIDDRTAQNIFDSALNSSVSPVLESQKNQIKFLTDESLDPLNFGNALEADIYIFDKLDESLQCGIADTIINFQYQENQNKVENNLESVNDEHQSSGLVI